MKWLIKQTVQLRQGGYVTDLSQIFEEVPDSRDDIEEFLEAIHQGHKLKLQYESRYTYVSGFLHGSQWRKGRYSKI